MSTHRKSPFVYLDTLPSVLINHINELKACLLEATKEDVINYYMDLHPHEARESFKYGQKRHWESRYRYGIAKSCCQSCEELEEAISQLLRKEENAEKFTQWFPSIANYVLQGQLGYDIHREKTEQEIRDEIKAAGSTIGQWAEENGFLQGSVYSVLSGKTKASRGSSQKIAVALGLQLSPQQQKENKINKEKREQGKKKKIAHKKHKERS